MIKQFGHTWWGKQWLNALSDIDFSNRLPRGKTYARNGKARNIIIMGNTVNAEVQGTQRKPYEVGMALEAFSNIDKQQVMACITGNPAVESQATDRAYRIGQKNKVFVHRLLTQGTFEEKINKMLEEKLELANMAVATGKNGSVSFLINT